LCLAGEEFKNSVKVAVKFIRKLINFQQTERVGNNRARGERDTHFLFPTQEMGAKTENAGPHLLVS
jgi:hypothetical protein